MDTDITILVDTREQRPLAFPGFLTERTTLATGDYSCVYDGQDLREVVAIERKSVSDLLGCIDGEREQFEQEMCRLAQYQFRALVVEDTMAEFVTASRNTQLSVKQALSSTLAWVFKYQLPVMFCSGRSYAAATVRTLLLHAARYARDDNLAPQRLTIFEKDLAQALKPLRAALCDIADVLDRGHKKHPEDDGFRQSAEFHIGRARQHLELLAAGDAAESHLEHAACRLLMAMEAQARSAISNGRYDSGKARQLLAAAVSCLATEVDR